LGLNLFLAGKRDHQPEWLWCCRNSNAASIVRSGQLVLYHFQEKSIAISRDSREGGRLLLRGIIGVSNVLQLQEVGDIHHKCLCGEPNFD
jgi:hypothetical protein